jgi:hypothetical protein
LVSLERARGGEKQSMKATKLLLITYTLSIFCTSYAQSQDGHVVAGDLWIRAIIQTQSNGEIDGLWRQGGKETTDQGDSIIWGYIHARSSDVDWGSPNNPCMLVKIRVKESGVNEIDFFNVSALAIRVQSDYPRDGTVDKTAQTSTDTRHVRHTYSSTVSSCPLEIIDWKPKGFSATARPEISATIKSQCGTNIDKASIKMLVDDSPITPTIEGSGSEVTVSYTPSSLLEEEADHSVLIAAKDLNKVLVENEWVFWVDLIY